MAKKTKDSNLSIEERLEQALIPNWDEPYKLPKNWCWVKLSTVCRLESGEKSVEKDLVYLDAKTLRGVAEPKTRDSGIIVNKDQKVILVDGENSGEVFVVPYRGYMGSTFKIINITENADEMYIRYFIDQNREKLRNNKIGSAIPHLNKDLFFNLELPFPPLSEQKRIVFHIESLFAKLEETKEKAQDVVDGFETRKAAILHKAFSGELTSKWRKENNIVYDWLLTSLDAVSEKIFDGPFGSNLKSEDYVSEGVRVVRLENIKNLWFDDSKKSFVSKEKYDIIRKHTVYPSDLIMSTFIADETKVCQMPEYISYAVNKADCIGIRLKPDVNKKYVLYFLSSKIVFNILQEQIHGATRPRVNSKQIKSIGIKLPSISEQNEIVFILDELLAKEQKVKEAAETVIEQINMMKKAILSRAFCGELGTNDPSEESALELLKSVLTGNTNQIELPKSNKKRTSIPDHIGTVLLTKLEKKIISLFYTTESKVISVDDIMSVSLKKIDIIDTLTKLEQRGILIRLNNSCYRIKE